LRRRVRWAVTLILLLSPVSLWGADRVEPGDSLAGGAIGFYQKYISDLRRGHCQFEPSCSQYAYDAIQSRGTLVGTALAADRLIRCNARARYWYARGEDGRLLDDPSGEPVARDNIRVPEWLLPRIAAVALPESLKQYADFAYSLESDGDCYRAATEYRRITFLGRSPDLGYWAGMKSAACYFRNGQWEEAAAEFEAASTRAQRPDQRNSAWFAVAAAQFNRHDFKKCSEILGESHFEWEGARDSADSIMSREDWLVLDGLCAMSLGNWVNAQDRFGEAAKDFAASSDEPRLQLLLARARGGSQIGRKRPNLAAAMSAILPGSGQIYAGRYYDGLRHFMFNALLISVVYELIEDESYPGAYLVAGVALPFYLGNILGAKRAAELSNKDRRSRYVAETIAATEE